MESKYVFMRTRVVLKYAHGNSKLTRVWYNEKSLQMTFVSQSDSGILGSAFHPPMKVEEPKYWYYGNRVYYSVKSEIKTRRVCKF